jgi:hypothetical protein
MPPCNLAPKPYAIDLHHFIDTKALPGLSYAVAAV